MQELEELHASEMEAIKNLTTEPIPSVIQGKTLKETQEQIPKDTEKQALTQIRQEISKQIQELAIQDQVKETEAKTEEENAEQNIEDQPHSTTDELEILIRSTEYLSSEKHCTDQHLRELQAGMPQQERITNALLRLCEVEGCGLLKSVVRNNNGEKLATCIKYHSEPPLTREQIFTCMQQPVEIILLVYRQWNKLAVVRTEAVQKSLKETLAVLDGWSKKLADDHTKSKDEIIKRLEAIIKQAGQLKDKVNQSTEQQHNPLSQMTVQIKDALRTRKSTFEDLKNQTDTLKKELDAMVTQLSPVIHTLPLNFDTDKNRILFNKVRQIEAKVSEFGKVLTDEDAVGWQAQFDIRALVRTNELVDRALKEALIASL